MSDEVLYARRIDPGRLRWGMLAILLAQFLALLDGLIVSVALPSIVRELAIDPVDAHWIVNAYTVAFAGLLVIGGRAADLLGRRRSFALGQLVLLGGSLLGGMVAEPAAVIAARVLQAIGAAVSSPAALGLLADAFRDEAERSRAFGRLTIGGGFGWISAALFGGVITEYFGWQGVFLLNVPLSAVAIALARLVLWDSPRTARPGRLDWAGALLLVATLSLLVYTLSRVERVGLFSMPTLGGLAVAMVLAVAFLLNEQHVTDPILPLSLLTVRAVRGAGILGLVFPIGFVATQFLGTQYLQDVLGTSPAVAGYAFLPLAAVPLVVGPVVSRAYPRFGLVRSVAAGFAGVAAGLGLIALAGPAAGYLGGPLPGFFLVGIGLTMIYIPLGVASVADVPETQYGLASAVFATSNQMGGALALALLSAVSTSVAASVGGPVGHSAGLRAGFAVGAVLCGIGAVAAAPLLRARGALIA
jgi:MFS family permease